MREESLQRQVQRVGFKVEGSSRRSKVEASLAPVSMVRAMGTLRALRVAVGLQPRVTSGLERRPSPGLTAR